MPMEIHIKSDVLTRNRKSIINLEEGIDKNIEIVEGDLLNYSDC